MATVKIEGLEALKKELKKLGEKKAKNIMVSGLRAGANDFKKTAKSLVPVDKGTLKKSLTVKKRKTNKNFIKFSMGWTQQKKGAEGSIVGGKNVKHDAYYAHIVEYGSIHQAAQPFIRPTFDTKKSSVTDAITKQIAKRIEKEYK